MLVFRLYVGGATELGEDGRDAARGHSLDIPFGRGGGEGAFSAQAFFEAGRVEVWTSPDLGHAQSQGTDPAGQGFGFEAIGMALAVRAALVGLGLEGARAFELHGFVDEGGLGGGQTVAALIDNEVDDVGKGG